MLPNLTGNIENKSDIGDYRYNLLNHPHAVSEINNGTDVIPVQTQDISFNHFNKVKTVAENNYELNIDYGVGGIRRHTALKQGANTIKEKYFVGNYEEIHEGSSVTKNYYVPGPAGNLAVYQLKDNLPRYDTNSYWKG